MHSKTRRCTHLTPQTVLHHSGSSFAMARKHLRPGTASNRANVLKSHVQKGNMKPLSAAATIPTLTCSTGAVAPGYV